MPYITIGIFEPGTDKELAYGMQGEICISGPSIMKEYLNNAEETNKVVFIHSDGKRWVHTKDIGYMDENGHVFHVDRIKNIFMRTGFNVHPSKISEFINTISNVKNSAVIGFDHPKEQCVPIAFVQIDIDNPSQELLEEMKKRILSLCKENLEETSVPYDIVFVDDLPINVGGKIDIRTIKEKSHIDLMKDEKILIKKISFN